MWDVAVPYDATFVQVDLISGWQSNDYGGNRGASYLVNRTAWLDATGMSLGGPTNWRTGSYVGFFSKVASNLEISHRIWTTSGQYVSLIDLYLATTGPTTRVLRMVFQNYGAAYYPLNIPGGSIGVLG